MAPTYEVAGTMAFAGVSVEDAAAHEDVFVAAIAGVAGVPPEDVSITSFAAAARRRLDECEPCDGDAGCGNLYTADDCANAAEVLGDPGKVCAWTPCDEEGGGDTAAVSVAYAIRLPMVRRASAPPSRTVRTQSAARQLQQSLELQPPTQPPAPV
ncbi:DNA-directed 5'-3' RNA polymerase [Aureococcus anophagefferens]|nr:DNA-directed 5'-3' RNA polymerase [Aureococcus anophagefferens]